MTIDDYKSYYAVAARWKTTDDKIGVLLKKTIKTLYIHIFIIYTFINAYLYKEIQESKYTEFDNVVDVHTHL